MRVFDNVLGLGPSCRTGFQIRRVFGKTKCLPSVFDRRNTPLPTIIEYFRHDFRGFFEREDFGGSAPVVNRKYRTEHVHEFKYGAPIDEYFPKAKADHERVCEIMRSALSPGSSCLFVIHARAADDFIAELKSVVANSRPSVEFDVVAVADTGAYKRPDGNEWKGCDQAWDEALAGYAVRGSLKSAALEWRRRILKHAVGSM